MSTGPAVIITRPAAQAVGLARHVAALGRPVVLFPLLEIHALPDQTALRAQLSDLEQYALVAFVSPNAIDATFAHIAVWPSTVAIAVMGEGSRAALAAHGVNEANATIFKPRDAKRTDSETLLEVLNIDVLCGRKVLIIRGDSGREFLAERLREHAIEVVQIAAYTRCAPQLTPVRREQLETLLSTRNDWIVTSSEALRNLVTMTQQLGELSFVAKMQQQKIIVPHARIAETARLAGFADVYLTGSGDEQLLAALQFTA